MLKFNASAFYNVTADLATLTAWVDADPQNETGFEQAREKLQPVDLQAFAKRLVSLKEHLGVLGAKMTALSLEDAAFYVASGDADWEGTQKRLEGVIGRLKDELSLTNIFVISPEKSAVVKAGNLAFGAAVTEKFPSLAYEIGEAGLCLALERSTASVFHSVRCLEAGIRALSRCLGISNPVKSAGRSWGKTLEAIDDAIQAKWPGSAKRQSGDGKFFDDVYTALVAIQNPYRNASMHLDRKYTVDEAQHIFDMVKGFIKKTASRCDEDGLPRA